jgi:hypothetical protein
VRRRRRLLTMADEAVQHPDRGDHLEGQQDRAGPGQLHSASSSALGAAVRTVLGTEVGQRRPPARKSLRDEPDGLAAGMRPTKLRLPRQDWATADPSIPRPKLPTDKGGTGHGVVGVAAESMPGTSPAMLLILATSASSVDGS